MPPKKPKSNRRTIAGRKERLSAAKGKAKSVMDIINKSMKPSRSFKEAAGVAATVAGPGKIFKAGKVLKGKKAQAAFDRKLEAKGLKKAPKRVSSKSSKVGPKSAATRKAAADKAKKMVAARGKKKFQRSGGPTKAQMMKKTGQKEIGDLSKKLRLTDKQVRDKLSGADRLKRKLDFMKSK